MASHLFTFSQVLLLARVAAVVEGAVLAKITDASHQMFPQGATVNRDTQTTRVHFLPPDDSSLMQIGFESPVEGFFFVENRGTARQAPCGFSNLEPNVLVVLAEER